MDMTVGIPCKLVVKRSNGSILDMTCEALRMFWKSPKSENVKHSLQHVLVFQENILFCEPQVKNYPSADKITCKYNTTNVFLSSLKPTMVHA